MADNDFVLVKCSLAGTCIMHILGEDAESGGQTVDLNIPEIDNLMRLLASAKQYLEAQEKQP